MSNYNKNGTMKAMVYLGPFKKEVQNVQQPIIKEPTDVIVNITKTTICGTDLHILKGDVPDVKPGTILGHEGIGVIVDIGPAVRGFKIGDRVLISCITSCGSCDNCKKQLYSHCRDGGWILGHLINGTQAEYVRIPHADYSLHKLPSGVNDDSFVMLSDIFPTGFEIGVLAGQVSPGDTVAIVGAGPVGLASLLTAQFYSPEKIIMIDPNHERLDVAKQLGASNIINNKDEDPLKIIKELTTDGVDVAIEAVGIADTFNICQNIIKPSGRIAIVGVHGTSVDLALNDLWIKNITITTGLVNTNQTPFLLKMVNAKKINPLELITHHFKFDEIIKAYEIFKEATINKTLKVIIENT